MPAAIQEEPVLRAALEVMAKRGYAGTTTKLIAEAAGIGEATLFRRFGTKDALLRKAMESEAARLGGDVDLYTGDLEADLTRIAETYCVLLNEHSLLLLTYATEISRYPDLRESVQTPLQLVQKLCGLLKRYQNEGKLLPEPPEQQLAGLLGPLLIKSVYRTVGISGGPVSAENHVKLFLGGRAVGSAAVG